MDVVWTLTDVNPAPALQVADVSKGGEKKRSL